METKKISSIMTLARWAWGRAEGVRGRIMLTCLLGVLRVGLSLTFVMVSKKAVDVAVDTHMSDTHGLMLLSVILVGLMLAEIAISLTVQFLSAKTEVVFKNTLRSTLFQQLMGTQWISLQSMHSGDVLNRLMEDVRMITDVVCQRLQQVVVMIVQFVGAFVLLCFLSWKLAVCVVGIMPLFVLLSKVYVRRTRSITSKIRQAESGAQTAMQEGLQHHLVVQSMESEVQIERRLNVNLDTIFTSTMSRTRLSVFSRGMVQGGFVTCYLTAFLWSVWHLHTGAITFGTMTAFLQLVARIQTPVVNISQYIPSLVQAMSSIDRLIELDLLPRDRKQAPIQLKEPVGIRIEKLNFSYGEDEREIFNGFSHDFTPGSKTVVMGETGVGKSTLVKLLLGLLYPVSGEIRIYDGDKDVTVSPDTRCNMTYVPQGNTLLEGTIIENLRLIAPDATDAQMRKALHTAVADFVYDLPQGLETRCGELGYGLSEGQAQRIAIARALLRERPILLLDEFNSSLDEHTASILLERFVNEYPQRTIIFISHRREVISACDQVVRLKYT